MATLETLAARLQRRVDDEAKRILKGVTFATFAELQATTPVDTGHARANWTMSVGVPDHNTYSINRSGNLLSDGEITGWQSIFISNNVPYIVRLNEGWSQQAPTGFIQMAISRGLQEVES